MKNILLPVFIFLSVVACAQDTSTYFTRKGVAYKRFDYVQDLSDMINISPFSMKSATGFTLSGDAHIDYAPNEGVSLGIKLQHKWLGFAISYAPKKLQDQDIGESDFINIVLNSYGRSFGFDAYYLTYAGSFGQLYIVYISDVRNTAIKSCCQQCASHIPPSFL